jgi:FeS assembly SUF system protein
MSEDDRLDQATRFLADEPGDTPAPAVGGTGDPDVDALGERVVDALRTVYDPEIPVNIFELGLIYKVDIDDDRQVRIDMTLTSPACPVAGTLPDEVRDKVEAIDGVAGATVEVVWDPPWHPGMMTEEAQLELGMMY